MLPFIIAGAVGFGIAKLLEKDETGKFADGGLLKVGDKVNIPEINYPNSKVYFEEVKDGEILYIEDGIYSVYNPKTNQIHRVTIDQIESGTTKFISGGTADGNEKNVMGNAFYITEKSVKNANKDFNKLSETFFDSKEHFENNLDAIQEFYFNVYVENQWNIVPAIYEEMEKENVGKNEGAIQIIGFDTNSYYFNSDLPYDPREDEDKYNDDDYGIGGKTKFKGEGNGKSFLHLYKLTYPNGIYDVETYDGYYMSPNDAMQKMKINLKNFKSYKYKGVSSDSIQYKEWFDRKNIGYSDTEAWEEVFESPIKMANGGTTKFMSGGMTNEDILRSFLTSERETQTNNLATFYSTLGGVMLLRNYGTLIAKRMGRNVEITNVKYSMTTTKITNRLKALAQQMGYNVTYVSEFEGGGTITGFDLENYSNYDEFYNVVFEYIKKEEDLSEEETKDICIVNESIIEAEFDRGSSPRFTADVILGFRTNENYADGGVAKRRRRTNAQYGRSDRSIDKTRVAKPVGYRFTDALATKLRKDKYAVPTEKQVGKYNGNGIYKENRRNKSDRNRIEKL